MELHRSRSQSLLQSSISSIKTHIQINGIKFEEPEIKAYDCGQLIFLKGCQDNLLKKEVVLTNSAKMTGEPHAGVKLVPYITPYLT